MLQQAHARKKDRYDVVVGVVETHGRRETEALLQSLVRSTSRSRPSEPWSTSFPPPTSPRCANSRCAAPPSESTNNCSTRCRRMRSRAMGGRRTNPGLRQRRPASRKPHPLRQTAGRPPARSVDRALCRRPARRTTHRDRARPGGRHAAARAGARR
jgi:hypothetical protein